MVQFVEELEEFQAILKEKADKLVVVDFTASWCGPCKVIGPKFEAMAEKTDNKDVVVFLKVDVNEAEDIAAFYEVTCMPTFLFFKNEVKVYHFSGANAALLEEKIIELRS